LGPTFLHAIQYALAQHHREVVNYHQAHRMNAVEEIRDILGEWPTMTMGVDEAYLLRSAVQQTSKIEGDLAEVGVYRGASAKVIAEVKGDRVLHLFDTFEGLPEPGRIDSAFHQGQYACGLERVREYLSRYPNVQFHKGCFPQDTGDSVEDRAFSFVHLDVDLYESTRNALRFFYPRVNRGGVIVSHDYVQFPPVRHAFNEFFSDKPEPVIELSGNQCMVVKVAPRS
jgi:hypothetical protein